MHLLPNQIQPLFFKRRILFLQIFQTILDKEHRIYSILSLNDWVKILLNHFKDVLKKSYNLLTNEQVKWSILIVSIAFFLWITLIVNWVIPYKIGKQFIHNSHVLCLDGFEFLLLLLTFNYLLVFISILLWFIEVIEHDVDERVSTLIILCWVTCWLASVWFILCSNVALSLFHFFINFFRSKSL